MAGGCSPPAMPSFPKVQAAQLSIAAYPIDVISINDWSVDYGMQAIRVDFTIALAFSEHSSPVPQQFKERRPVIEGRHQRGGIQNIAALC
jgi:hypothetical protein